MKYLLDTNIISEVKKKDKDHKVITWLNNIDPEHIYFSILTIGELKSGILRKEPGKLRLELERWLDDEIIDVYADRILPIDTPVITKWSQLTAENKKIGRPLTVIDSLIASTALAHDLKLVTRNVKDYKGIVDYINPFE